MESREADALARIFSLALIALAIWLIGSAFNGQPRPLGLDAPATEFSAARADRILKRLLGPEVPHPVSTPANQAVRDRVRAEFAALGITTSLYQGLGCEGRAKFGFFACGTAQDILAEVAPGKGKAIVLMAHYDSVPAGPGASDDQSSVATILETVRALQARGMKTQHPILALITDGEEAGLLGAAAFLDNPALKARVGAVVNVEARGNQGPSSLFQTSPGDGPLIDLYARSVPNYATSSLFAVVYKFLPNDTDLTLFINQGFTSFNFAFIGNIAHYHTALDRRANLSQSTLQMHGDNLLGMASGLMQTDFATLKGGDDVYLTVLGRFLPRMPASWALPLALATLVLLLLAAFTSRKEKSEVGGWFAATLVPPAAVLLSAAFGWVLHEIASLVSGQPDPSYAYPVFLRIALAIGVAAMIMFTTRLANARMMALSVWLWFSGLGVASAALLPGLSPYFLFPALIGSVLVLAQSRSAGAWTGTTGMTALLLAAIFPLLIWFSLSAMAETVQGLAVHPLFTVPLAFGAIALLPVLAANPLSARSWLRLTSALGGAAIVVAIVAGMQPAYSEITPQRLSINFIDDHVSNKALWSVDTPATLPRALRDVEPFSREPQMASPIAFQRSYVADAGATRFAAPSATVISSPDAKGRSVTLRLAGSPQANRMFVVVPKDSALTSIEIEGKTFMAGESTINPAGTIFGCLTNDCSGKAVTLNFASAKPVDILIGEQRYGLPPDGAKLEAARPATTVPSQTGDTVIVFGKLRLP